jgi:hypothetical protein
MNKSSPNRNSENIILIEGLNKNKEEKDLVHNQKSENIMMINGEII